MQLKKPLLMTSVILFFMSAGSLISCSKNASDATTAADPLAVLNLPSVPYNYAAQPWPAYLQSSLIAAQDNTPSANPVTDWGATLGRVLFYDKALSLNQTISCASCHKQEFSFSDTAALSTGFDGQFTGRNSMSLVNARYYPNGKFFWDQRAATLEAQVLTPIQDHKEMGMTLDSLINRLSAKSYYPVLFTNAFGSPVISSDRVSKALAQFVRSIVSYQSKFDIGRSAVPPGQDPFLTPYTNFTASENLGKQLFFSQRTACNTCHGSETFSAPGDRNNGIEDPSVDQGVGGVSKLQVQVGNFKVPSLKNIALTFPYMHDGRFKTLQEVIEHYNSGVQPNPNLAPQLKNPDGSPRRLNLTDEEKTALLDFLHTLTDRSILTDNKFSDPFR